MPRAPITGTLRLELIFTARFSLTPAIRKAIAARLVKQSKIQDLELSGLKFGSKVVTFVATFQKINPNSLIASLKTLTSRDVNKVRDTSKTEFWEAGYTFESVDSS